MENVSWLDPITAKVFVTTRWSLIAACSQANEEQSREAIAEICQTYWQPVYACIRHNGHSAHDAQDLTQDFFLHLLRGRWLKHLNAAKGRFRAYLSVALQNFLHDRWRRRWTFRRGRGFELISFEAEEAERGYVSCLATEATPEGIYERQWARSVIKHAFDQLRIEMQAGGNEVLLDHFDAILTADTKHFPYGKVAESLGMKVGALHVALHRWRQRFQALVRIEVARTVLSKTEIEDELRHLQRLFVRDL